LKQKQAERRATEELELAKEEAEAQWQTVLRLISTIESKMEAAVTAGDYGAAQRFQLKLSEMTQAKQQGEALRCAAAVETIAQQRLTKQLFELGERMQVIISSAPPSSSPSLVSPSSQSDRLKMRRITNATQREALQQLCSPEDLSQLGIGQDYHEPTNRGLPPKVAGAWAIDNPVLALMYKGGRMMVRKTCKQLAPAEVKLRPGLESAIAEMLVSMEGQYGDVAMPLELDINEKFLLHSPNMQALHSILEHGFNEHYAGSNAGTAYGEGSYFAEDIGKTDQYAQIDQGFNAFPELHRYAH
jgi:hypothetical protein